ncbi:hypothetical protein IWX90DRAFT_442423 [Phyllosticta citrichinensis]|uniref:Secreted protein n=1 Tax=Phyllosticta citrichinensis TaxID=1130410 RepID=A0ABR1XJM9_9PEZI
MIVLLTALLAVLPASLAFQIPHVHIPNIFSGHGSHHDEPPHFCPIIDKQEKISAKAWQVGASVPNGGCTSYVRPCASLSTASFIRLTHH